MLQKSTDNMKQLGNNSLPKILDEGIIEEENNQRTLEYRQAEIKKLLAQEKEEQKRGCRPNLERGAKILLLLLSSVAITSFACNYQAIQDLFADFAEAYGLDYSSEMLTKAVAGLAGVGGVASNFMLTFIGGLSLVEQFYALLNLAKTKAPEFLGASFALGSGVFAALANGLNVALELYQRGDITRAFLSFLLNFLTNLPPHLLFGTAAMGTFERTIFSDLLRKTWHWIRGEGFNLEDNSRHYNDASRLLATLSFRMGSLSLSKQLTSYRNSILVAYSKSEEQPESMFLFLQYLVGWADKNQETDFSKLPVEEQHKTITDLSTYFSKLSETDQLKISLALVDNLKLNYDSTAWGATKTALNSLILFMAIASSAANMTNINVSLGKFLGTGVGLAFALIASPAKIILYGMSMMKLLSRVLNLGESIPWLRTQPALLQVVLPAISAIAVLTALLSGSCYANDANALFEDMFNGGFANLGESLGVEKIFETLTTLISWLGASFVNTSALVTALLKILDTLSAYLSPQYKAQNNFSKTIESLKSKLESKTLSQLDPEFSADLVKHHEKAHPKRASCSETGFFSRRDRNLEEPLIGEDANNNLTSKPSQKRHSRENWCGIM